MLLIAKILIGSGMLIALVSFFLCLCLANLKLLKLALILVL